MNLIKFGAVKIDPVAYGSQGSAVLGIRDSGKTYTATALAERLYDAGIPFIAFDPIGVWRFLRVPGEGRGYPVVVAGGQAGDLPLTVAAAPEYVRAAMRDGVSLVIDLFDINLSKADWKRIVMSCVRVLLHENSSHGLRHIFIEEAAEFAPQRVGPDQGQVYAEIEKLARMGGNARLGYTLINQRAEEVNKAVLELCDNLFLHRQKGRNSLTALSKWLDIGAVKDSKEIIDSLSTLPTGECWAWLAGSDRPVRIKVPTKNSLHPDRRVMRGDGAVKAKAAVDVGTFVTSMRASLGKIEQEAKANDPALLRKQIAELEKQLRAKPGAAPAVSRGEIKAAETRGFERGSRETQARLVRDVSSYFKATKAALHRAVEEAVLMPVFSAQPLPEKAPHTTTAIPPRIQPVRRESPPAKAPHAGNGSSPISSAARKILAVLSQYPEGCTAGKLTLLTGYRYSGSFQNALSELRTAGYIDGPNTGVMSITADGELQGPFPDLPKGDDLVQYWLNHPSLSKAARLILEQLKDGSERTADDLCSATGYSYSGSFQNALSELRTAGVLVGKNTERMRISPEIVP